MIDTVSKTTTDAKAKIVADIPVLDKAAKDAASKDKKAAKTSAGPKPIKAKTIKRRMARIGDEKNAKKARKMKDKLAAAIIRQIAAGTIKTPRAVAKAFVNAQEKNAEAKKADAPKSEEKKA
ncbi:MAG: hypothetical protein ACRBBS_03115 [Thalassovita sp.]